MSRENAAEKGARYLAEARLTVLRVDAGSIEAECRGGGAVYRLRHDGRSWWCSCPALTAGCSHLHALRLCTVRAVQR